MSLLESGGGGCIVTQGMKKNGIGNSSLRDIASQVAYGTSRKLEVPA
jgi:hypothetical protein